MLSMKYAIGPITAKSDVIRARYSTNALFTGWWYADSP